MTIVFAYIGLVVLRMDEGQHVVQSGPYRLVRHPGYLASLLVWIGFALANQNWVTTLAVALLMGYAYTRRMRAEEAMLETAFGRAYAEYRTRTWRILPYI